MPIISGEIMKTTDEREMQKATKEKWKKTERSKENRSYSESVRAKWFCCAFKLGFLQLICKASLTFKSNLELALSIILNQRGLYEMEHLTFWRISHFIKSFCLSFSLYKYKLAVSFKTNTV